MSWEDSPPVSRPCPCGNGRYVVVTRSDDWGRYEERWEMHCPLCKEEFGLYSFDYNHKGMATTRHGWLPRRQLQELETTESELEQTRDSLSAYAKGQFQEQWRKHFSGKTKKAIWRELTEDGRQYPSLPTFYLHVRESSLEQQLLRYFDYRELPTVIRLLRLKGSELHVRIERAGDLERLLIERQRCARQQVA